MARKTGIDVKIEVEVGNVFYSMAALATVASPAADVGKIYETNASFLSDREDLQPVVRLDGVISGFGLSVGAGFNDVAVAAGSAYIKGVLVEVAAQNLSGFKRPTTPGNVLVNAVTVDENGTLTVTAGTEGGAGGARGAAGGNPFLPVDEVLLGYVSMSYYGGTESGAKAIDSSEIDDETKERTIIPTYNILYYDGSRDNKLEKGVIQFATALPLIHAAAAAGPGTSRRNVYASYYDCSFEELGDVKDFGFNEDVATIASRAYGEKTEQKSLSTESWSGSGTAYWDKVGDILNLIKNSKRWFKYYPDKDETDYWAGRAIIKVSRSLPLDDNLSASLTLEGSGELYPII